MKFEFSWPSVLEMIENVDGQTRDVILVYSEVKHSVSPLSSVWDGEKRNASRMDGGYQSQLLIK